MTSLIPFNSPRKYLPLLAALFIHFASLNSVCIFGINTAFRWQLRFFYICELLCALVVTSVAFNTVTGSVLNYLITGCLGAVGRCQGQSVRMRSYLVR